MRPLLRLLLRWLQCMNTRHALPATLTSTLVVAMVSSCSLKGVDELTSTTRT